MTTRRAGLDQAIKSLQAVKDLHETHRQSAHTEQYTAEEVLQTLQNAGYTITPPGQHTPSYNPTQKRNIIREKLADANECAKLLDRSQPKPDWAKGKEEQILKELELQLLGLWDHMSPFGR